MRKRKLAGIFASLMLSAGVLAGCGGSSSSNGDEIKVGINLELSGGVASFGKSAAQGVELGFEEINKEGIDGKKVKLITVDNKSDAAESTSAALKLMGEEKVVAIIGAATSTNTIAEADVSTSNQIPVISPTGTNPAVTVTKDGKVNEFMFRTCFIDPFQGTVAANFASNELKVKNAAILTDTASDYAKGLATAFKESFTKNGGNVFGESYVAKDTDFKATLTRIKSKNPDFVFVPGYYEEVGLILKQAREIGLNVPFMGGDGWDSPKLLELAGKDALANTFITNHYSSGDPDPKIQDFAKAYKAKYNVEPDAFAALGYDSAYFLADAIKRAGSTDSVKIKDAIAATKDLALVSGVITVDKNHDPIKSAVILEFKDGVQTFKTKVNP